MPDDKIKAGAGDRVVATQMFKYKEDGSNGTIHIGTSGIVGRRWSDNMCLVAWTNHREMVTLDSLFEVVSRVEVVRHINARACPHDTFVSCFDDDGCRRCTIDCKCLCHQPVDVERFIKAPCYLCDYSGELYYNSDNHPCAARYHEEIERLRKQDLEKAVLPTYIELLKRAESAERILKEHQQVVVTARQAVADMVVERNKARTDLKKSEEQHEQALLTRWEWFKQICTLLDVMPGSPSEHGERWLVSHALAAITKLQAELRQASGGEDLKVSCSKLLHKVDQLRAQLSTVVGHLEGDTESSETGLTNDNDRLQWIIDVIATLKAPIPMRLPCPDCGELHVDVEFADKPHHTHACQHCGMVWRPAVKPTVGVFFLPGFKDATPPATPESGPTPMVGGLHGIEMALDRVNDTMRSSLEDIRGEIGRKR